jgi:adenylate cyclase
MLHLRVIRGGDPRTLALEGDRLTIGRRADNDLQLPDYSVSRLHAHLRRSAEGWVLTDNGSTNGVVVNGGRVNSIRLGSGDRLTIGAFELLVEGREDPPAAGLAAAGSAPASEPSSLANATIIRSLASFTAAFGERGEGIISRSSLEAQEERHRLNSRDGQEIFGILTRLGRLMIEAATVEAVLEGLLSVAFDALPVDRGFVMLRDEKTDTLRCALMRSGDKVTVRPHAVPVSYTMLETVARERVALVTADAQSDQRLAANESVHLHQIRAAMCAPLWSGDRIFGVIQVDSPHDTHAFTEHDVDLLTALANYGAVAVERLRHAERIAFDRQVRSRLERYHSPAVIESVLEDVADQNVDPIRRLEPAEVSILFADVVGFTSFCAQAPPARVAEVMEAFFEYAVEAIFDCGGTLDKFIGDCVMAFFGAPMVQEDHARRAVRSALAIQQAVGRWNAERAQQGLDSFSVRVGVNSGPVMVGDLGSRRRVDYTVLGNTVNIAARLESSVAQPGDVVIGPVTRTMLGQDFAVVSLGSTQLRGLGEPLETFRVIGEVAREEVAG